MHCPAAILAFASIDQSGKKYASHSRAPPTQWTNKFVECHTKHTIDTTIPFSRDAGVDAGAREIEKFIYFVSHHSSLLDGISRRDGFSFFGKPEKNAGSINFARLNN